MQRSFQLAIIIGLCSGLLGGLLGVGGGIILVPAMVLLFGLSQLKAQGTSLLVIISTALAGGAMHLYYGNVDLPLVALLIAGSIAGAYTGASIVTHIPEKKLRRGFGMLIIAVGLKMIFW